MSELVPLCERMGAEVWSTLSSGRDGAECGGARSAELHSAESRSELSVRQTGAPRSET